jgi:hypothetical protein
MGLLRPLKDLKKDRDCMDGLAWWRDPFNAVAMRLRSGNFAIRRRASARAFERAAKVVSGEETSESGLSQFATRRVVTATP